MKSICEYDQESLIGKTKVYPRHPQDRHVGYMSGVADKNLHAKVINQNVKKTNFNGRQCESLRRNENNGKKNNIDKSERDKLIENLNAKRDFIDLIPSNTNRVVRVQE